MFAPLRIVTFTAFVALVLLGTPQLTLSQTVARCGQGWLELIDGYPVLHLQGTPYEMGFQHGALLKEPIHQNMHSVLRVKGETTLVELGPLKVKPIQALQAIVHMQKKFVPQKYFEEIEGLSAGADVKLDDTRALNFIPELFHCSGFAIMNSATKDGTLYHGRVLDYAIDWGLQDHAVIVVAQPNGRIPFVNVSYAAARSKDGSQPKERELRSIGSVLSTRSLDSGAGRTQ